MLFEHGEELRDGEDSDTLVTQVTDEIQITLPIVIPGNSKRCTTNESSFEKDIVLCVPTEMNRSSGCHHVSHLDNEMEKSSNLLFGVLNTSPNAIPGGYLHDLTKEGE